MEQAIDVGSLLALLAVLAYLVYALVELLLAPWLWRGDESKADLRKTVLQIAAAVVGVLLAIVFRLDLFSALVQIFKPVEYGTLAQYVGMVCTGLLLGRGAEWLHALRKILPVGGNPGAGLLTQ